MTAATPSGVVTFLFTDITFLFTDIEGSTRRWEADAEAMRAALLALDEVLRTAIEGHGGYVFSHTGDGVIAAFLLAEICGRRGGRRAAGTGVAGADGYCNW
jgi:class 3 adenylate cyclase